jgi:y4mF family transcriptional regulator
VNTKEIGFAIKQRRQSLKVRQVELSELAGVGINTLVAIERGQGNPKLETLLSVLDTLGLQMNIKLKD